MKKFSIVLFLFFALTTIYTQTNRSITKWNLQTFYTIPKLSIRALYVVSDNEVWFAANHGCWGYTKDGGVTWKIDSIQVDGLFPEFRGIAVLNDSTVLLMGIASPGFIFKTTNKGKTWKIVFRNNQKEIFFDSMIFKDKKNGMVIADPIHQEVLILKTKDGGDTWQLDSNEVAPIFDTNTAFFASSNTNIEWKKNHIWLVTGGGNSDVWLNENKAYTFDRYETGFPEGETMTGIYSMDFWDSKLGVIAGGNYDKADTSITILAMTKDSGKHWEEIKIDQPMFGSCVQFLNKNELFVTGKPGTFHYDLKKKKILYIIDSENKNIGFHTLRISPSKKVVWLAGGDGKIGKIDLNKNVK
jgi:photosystem II stability/assembly factor-like uncharacterized protein